MPLLSSFFDPTLAGATCYPILKYLGQYLNAGTYENFTASHWIGYAAVGTVTADGNGGFSCPIPSGTGNGPVLVTWYQRAGGTPATSDDPVYDETYVVSSDPWATTLPGGYSAGTAGNILGTNLDVRVSTRSTFSGGTVTSVTGSVGSVTSPVDINLAQAITDAKTATVGGSLAGAWATAWGKVTKNLSTKILKLWGPGNTTGTPSTTFLLDDANNPTTKTPQ